jgi:hypothetical protein
MYKRKTDRKYTFSNKRIADSVKRANWETRLEVFNLVNQGWSFATVAKYMTDKGYKMTRARAHQIWHKVKDMTIDQLQTAVLGRRNETK